MEIDGASYRINTDFRAGIAYVRAVSSSSPVSAQWVTTLFFGAQEITYSDDVQQAVTEYINLGRDGGENADEGAATPYDFDKDAGVIFAAFRKEYGIDLATAKMHWWEFRTLLEALICHSFAERVQYRVSDPSQIKSRESRAYWRKMQQLYALEEDGGRRKCESAKTVEEYNKMLLAEAGG